MLLKKYTAGALAAVLLATSIEAVAADWTLEKLARQALATYPDIIGKEYSLNAAEANVKAATWQRFPTLSVEGGQANDGYSKFTDVSLTQPLWTGGRITGGIRSAEAQKNAAMEKIDETRQDVLLRVVTAYAEAIRQESREAIAQKEVEQHQQLLDMITRRVEAQASARVDGELAQSRLYQAQNDLSSASQALAMALTQLSELAGMPVSAVADFSIQGLQLPDSVEVAVDSAIGQSPTLKRYDYEKEAAEADIKVKKAAYFPQVSLRFDKFYGQDPLTARNTPQSSRVMLLVEAQPGAGLSAVAGADSAVAARDAAIEAQASALRELRQSVSTDWQDLKGSRERFNGAALSSASSKAVYESYVRQYATGKKSWLDVMNTVRESIQAEMNVADAKAQMTAAALRLEVKAGNLPFLQDVTDASPVQNQSN
jgi:adhesin transport system outer membrane protein